MITHQYDQKDDDDIEREIMRNLFIGINILKR